MEPVEKTTIKTKKQKYIYPIAFILVTLLIGAFKTGTVFNNEKSLPELLEKKYHEKFVFDGYMEQANGTKLAMMSSVSHPEIKFTAQWNPPDVNDNYVNALFVDYAERKVNKILIPKAGERIFWHGGSGYARNDYAGQWEFFKKYGVKDIDKVFDEHPEVRNRGGGFAIHIYGVPERKDEMVREIYDYAFALKRAFKSEDDILGYSYVADIAKLKQFPELESYYAEKDFISADVLLDKRKDFIWRYGRSDGEPALSSLTYKEFYDFDRKKCPDYYKQFDSVKGLQ